MLEHRKLFDKVIKMQAEKGDDAVFASLQGVLNQEKLAQRIVGLHNPDELDMMIFTGVGAAYPNTVGRTGPVSTRARTGSPGEGAPRVICQ